MPGFHFVPGRFCVRCPLDTYQDKQGQTSCENCPVNTETFGKTGMTSKSNCSAGIITNNHYHIGCYNDTYSRAMPELLDNWRHDSQAADIFLVHLTYSGIESLAGLLNFDFRIL